MQLFGNTRFLLVLLLAGLGPLEQLRRVLLENGGECVQADALSVTSTLDQQRIDHVILDTLDFAGLTDVRARMIPLTNTLWVWDSLRDNQRKNYRLYAPDPPLFMDKVVLCIADNLPEGDKEVLYAAARAYGGQYLDTLLRYTTHLVALDLSTNKAVVASNIRKKALPNINIVLPHWVEECIRQQRRVDERPYLLSNQAVLESGKPQGTPSPSPENLSPGFQPLAAHRVYVADDFNLSQHLQDCVRDLVEHSGGSVVPLEDCTVYIGKWREGAKFAAACHASKYIGNLEWLFHVTSTGKFVDPLQSSLLHVPLPRNPVPGMTGLRVSITGISGDARHYLLQLLAAMGATFTKTLDAKNDYLVCARPDGEKYAAAQTRWNVAIVNFLWVERCFVSWQKLPASDYEDLLVKEPIGLVKFPSDFRQDWLTQLSSGSEVIDALDSENETESEHAHKKQKIEAYLDLSKLTQRSAHTESPSRGLDLENNKASLQDNEVEHVVELDQEMSEDAEPVSDEEEHNTDDGQDKEPETNDKSQAEERFYDVLSSPTKLQKSPDLQFVAASEVLSRSRSAKTKASLKLHSDMEDLNNYTSMSKSSRKMKSYMKDLELALEATNKLQKPDPRDQRKVESIPSQDGAKAKTDHTKKPKAAIVAVVTGCEQILDLSRIDIAKLRKAGIQVVPDISQSHVVDTIVAPKVLRTGKFLKCLSTATRIVHPSYLAGVLSRLPAEWESLQKEFNIEDYNLDRVVPAKQINSVLGVHGDRCGLQKILEPLRKAIFSGKSLNISLNVNGGADLIAGILHAHGAETKTVKLGPNMLQDLIKDESDTLVVANNAKDKKTFASLRKDNAKLKLLDWEWCVKSIFHGELQDYGPYVL